LGHDTHGDKGIQIEPSEKQGRSRQRLNRSSGYSLFRRRLSKLVVENAQDLGQEWNMAHPSNMSQARSNTEQASQ
jgi:hypothetical protein